MKAALLTRRELAGLRDLPGQTGPVHMMTVTKWERAGLPIAQRGRAGKPTLYSEVDCRAWLAAREEAAKNSGALDVAQERARKEHWQALLAEQLHQARERELLPRADVEKAWAAEVAAVRAKLLAWPTTLADRIHRAGALEGIAGVERALHEAVREVLRELAEGGGHAGEPAVKRGRRKGRAA
jgi:hypothetical protein